MTLRRLLQILAAHKLTMTSSIIAVVVLVAVAVAVTPPKYTATASVVVSNLSTDPVGGAQTQTLTGVGYVATQVSIINSHRVAREVVINLNLDKDPRMVGLWTQNSGERGNKIEWIADLLLGKLKVQPSRQSNVIDIGFVSTDPARATRIANAFAQAYLNTSISLKSDQAKQTAQFFDAQIEKLRRQLEMAQVRFSAAEKNSGQVVSTGRIDVESARMGDLSTQLALAHAQSAESTARRSSARNDNTTSPDVLQNGVIQQLKGQIAKSESQLTELAGRLGDRHPQYIRAQQEIDQMRSALSAETSRVSRSLDTVDQIGVLKVAQLQAAVDAQRRHILTLSVGRDNLSVLQREVDSAQRAYDLVMQRSSETTLQSQVAQTDSALLAMAVEPAEPSFPKIKLFAAMALVFGILLGAGLALMRDMLSPKIYGMEHFVQLTGISVFGEVPRHRVLPFFGALRSLGGNRRGAISAADISP